MPLPQHSEWPARCQPDRFRTVEVFERQRNRSRENQSAGVAEGPAVSTLQGQVKRCDNLLNAMPVCLNENSSRCKGRPKYLSMYSLAASSCQFREIYILLDIIC